jgi:hypothetical protein
MRVKKTATDWNIYRTRFLIKAKQLQQPLMFVDALGREQRGQQGDYLTEWSGGVRRIVPREFFEDVYVPLEPAGAQPRLAEPKRAPHRASLHPSERDGGRMRAFL